jgi:hypothetical protein
MKELDAEKPDGHGRLRHHEGREKDSPDDGEDREEKLGEMHCEAAEK